MKSVSQNNNQRNHKSFPLFFVFFLVVLRQVLNLAKQLRPFTAQSMKIEVAPWIKDYVTNMDDLYTELTLEKLEYQLYDNTTPVENYKEIFIDLRDQSDELQHTTSGNESCWKFCFHNLFPCLGNEMEEEQESLLNSDLDSKEQEAGNQG